MKALGPDQTIEIRVNNNEVKDLRELNSNPNINVGDIMEVSVYHISVNAHREVQVKCVIGNGSRGKYDNAFSKKSMV